MTTVKPESAKINYSSVATPNTTMFEHVEQVNPNKADDIGTNTKGLVGLVRNSDIRTTANANFRGVLACQKVKKTRTMACEVVRSASVSNKVNVGCMTMPYSKLSEFELDENMVSDVVVSNKNNLVSAATPHSNPSSKHSVTIRQALDACLSWRAPSTTQAEAFRASLAIRRSGGKAHVPKSKRDSILEARQSGQAVKDIALRFGVHRGTVWQIVKQAGMQPRRTALTVASVVAVRSFYEAGHSVVRTARQFGVGKNTMLAFMRQHNIPRRGRGRFAKVTCSPVPIRP